MDEHLAPPTPATAMARPAAARHAEIDHAHRAAFELAAVGIAQLDARTRRFVWANQIYCTITGYRLEELTGMTVADVTHPDDLAADAPLVSRFLSGKADAYTNEKRYVRKDGGVVWVSVAASLIRDGEGEPFQTVAVVQDVSERRRTERALRESEERFRATFEQAAVGIAMIGLDGRWQRVNHAFCDIVGFCESDLTRLRFQDVTHPDDLPGGVDSLQRLLAGEIGAYAREKRYRRKDGSVVWVHVTMSLVRTPEGAPHYLISVVKDISERKRAEALGEAGRRKDEFLAMLGHELRNPLAALGYALRVLRLGPHADDASRALELAERQTLNIGRLVDDLLDASRIAHGKIELRRRPVRLVGVIRQAAETARPLAEARQQSLTVALPAESVVVEADPTRLEQALVNLLTNAVKYTSPGGRVDLAAALDKGEAVVRIRDDGAGIDPELLPRVFDLFTQGPGALEAGSAGLGLGLAVAKRLVELHGGSIEAASDGPGRGAEFVIRLPLSSAAPREEPKPAREEGLPGALALRILVVDDNRAGAEALALLLGALGHQPEIASDGPTALAAFRARPHDVVLCDIGLPGMSGHEVARALRVESGGKNVLLVAVTGYGREEDKRRSLEAGFDLHFPKAPGCSVLEELLAARARATPPDSSEETP